MSFSLTHTIIDAINRHALREFPNEACGLIVDGEYLPQFNYAVHPEMNFVIAGEIWKDLADKGKTVEAVVHSHPNGAAYPSARDMQGQIDTDVPWVIVVTDGEVCGGPVMWGDSLPVAPLLGRPFMHGVADCYSLIRDAYRLGKDGIADPKNVSLSETISIADWPHEAVVLPDFPRNDEWWRSDGENASLYLDNFEKAGFRRIQQSDVQIGDVFLMRLGFKSAVPNHGGLYVGGNLVMHHIPTRASRREPLGVWLRSVDVWLRYEGNAHA